MKSVLKDKTYTHFDYRTHYQKYKGLVSNSEWVEHHGFYPFVHSEMKLDKYSQDKGRVEKTRHIYYSAHVDSYIYQYYGKLLNDHYNEYVKAIGTYDNAIAYRNCWEAKNNIHFAREVFEFICQQDSAYVYVTDLTNFFDSLDHFYLKQQIKRVLGVESLDGGNYAVFKSLTKFAYVDYKDLKDIAAEENKEIRKMERFFDLDEFHRRKKELIKKNKKNYGIPQGSSVSAVYANVYMVDFDKAMADYVSEWNGLYRRYCDDIIIVIPLKREQLYEYEKEIQKFIEEKEKQIPSVRINENKTERFFYENHVFYDPEHAAQPGQPKCAPKKLSYLGFDFDGINVRIRDKSIYKFFYRAYRKIDQVNALYYADKQKFIAGKKAVYNGYTHLFSKRHAKKKKQQHGNFYTYAKRAHDEFSKSSCLNSEIKRQIRRHWKKIEGRFK